VPYKRTKLEAERLALAAGRDGIDVVCVNPTTTVGPQDRLPTPSGKMIRDLVEGKIRGYLASAGLNVVAVEDVARGHALALATGRSGHRYILGGDDLSLHDVFAVAAAAVGRPAPRLGLPWPPVYGAAVVVDAIAHLRGQEPRLLVRDEVRLARLPLYFSSDKAKRELGYEPRPAAEAVEAAARWFGSGACERSQ
jgi:dihydroflavonol-4-reductase